MRSPVLIAAIAGVIALGQSSFSLAAMTYRTVALTGNAFTDYLGSTSTATSAGQYWGTLTANSNAFSNAVLNSSGQVVFQGAIAGTGVTSGTNDRGAWSEGSGSLKLIARRGDNSVDTSGTTTPGLLYSSTVLGPNINSAGNVLFLSTLSGNGVVTTGSASNNNAQFLDVGGINKMTLRLNDTITVNGASTVIRGLGSLPALNASGTYAIGATLSPATSGNNGVFTYGASGLTKVAVFGDTAPGTDLGSGLATFAATSSFGNPAINNAGTVAFYATLTTGTAGVISGTNARGIWTAAPNGTVSLLARAGNTAPGTNGGVFGSTIGTSPDINDSGVITFNANLATSGPINTNNDAGVWKGSSAANLILVAQKGAQVADLPTGVFYSAFNAPVISKTGGVAFTTTLSGTGVIASNNNTALMVETPTGLTTLARQGSAAPGGKLFSGFTSSTYFSVNADGRAAFLTSLVDIAGGSTTASGLFAQDFSGALQLVVQTGLPFEVASGVFKTPSSITFNNVSLTASGSGDGRASAWSDSYNIAFTLLFTDGSSGVFSASIPEPSSAGIIALSAIPLLSRRRRNG